MATIFMVMRVEFEHNTHTFVSAHEAKEGAADWARLLAFGVDPCDPYTGRPGEYEVWEVPLRLRGEPGEGVVIKNCDVADQGSEVPE